MSSTLVDTAQERGLGIIVHSSLKASAQWSAAGKEANMLLGIIKMGIENKVKNVLPN